MSVKAAGFSIFPLASLAPAVKVLFVVMMYVGVCKSLLCPSFYNVCLTFTQDPIAMSVRATNVYEEQSLGIFHEEESNKELGLHEDSAPRLSVLSQYVIMHVEKQLAFGVYLQILVG